MGTGYHEIVRRYGRPISDRILDTGYRLVRWHSQCWIQLPPNFGRDVIPDEYIFDPEWNRETVNAWWKEEARRGR